MKRNFNFYLKDPELLAEEEMHRMTTLDLRTECDRIPDEEELDEEKDIQLESR